MNKQRLEAFSDAILAIVITIMVLEIHIPETSHIADFVKSWPYFISYLVSFFMITVIWYNHHYLFAVTKHVSRATYWINAGWLFVVSLLPVMTGWVSEHITDRGPEYLYFVFYLLWSAIYVVLIERMARDNEVRSPEVADKIRQLPNYHGLLSPIFLGLCAAIMVATYFWPPISMIFIFGSLVYGALRVAPDGDQLF